MASKVNKKKRAKKSKELASGVELQDKVEETVQRTPDLVDEAPSLEQEAPSLVNAGLQQLNQRQHQGKEHSRDTAVPISAEGQFKDHPISGKKSKKKRTKKATDTQPHPSEEPSKEEKSFTFEEQIEWCIGQLELGLHRRDATKVQKDSNEKNIRTLRSLRVSVPRKRQLMRSLFGDYRSKMIATPPPEARAKEPYVNAVERNVAEGSGKFFKYRHSHSNLLSGAEGYNGYSEEQEPFRFDFMINS